MNENTQRDPPGERHISEPIILLDGIAILFIVEFHALFGQTDNLLFFLTRYLGYFGLSLFTFTAGYKIVLNHQNDLISRIFLGTYFSQRFIRLYKPYLGYTLLIFFPVIITYYFAFNVLHLSFPGITRLFNTLNTANMFTILAFFAGDNFVTGHLWYLIALICITAVCFTVIYLTDVRSLFIFFFPVAMLSLWLLTLADYFALGIVPKTIILIPSFIAGMFLAHSDNKNLSASTARAFFTVAFFILIIASTFIAGSPYSAVLIFLSGLLLPFFLPASFVYLNKITPINRFFHFAGTYSFAIYLFHLPLILLFLLRVVIDILHIHLFFIPLVLAVISMYLSVIVYLTLKKCRLNFLVE